jgi:hypothetical protein
VLRRSGHDHDGIWNYKIAPGGRHLVSWGAKGYTLVDLTSLKVLRRWPYGSPQPRSLAGFHFTPNGSLLLLSTGQNESWVVWDLAHNRAADTLPGLAGVKDLLWVYPDGRSGEAIRSADRARVGLWTGKVIQESPGEDLEPHRAVAGLYSPFGRCYVSRGTDGVLRYCPMPPRRKNVCRYQLPADDRSLSAMASTAARLSLSVDERYAALLTRRSLYVLRLPEPPAEKPN